MMATTDVFAFGSDMAWTAGYGQGIAEATITKGPGNRIYTACNDGGIGGSSISFELIGRAPTGNSILLTFDGEDPKAFSIWDGEIPSDCRACADTFESVIQKLKTHAWVHVRFENGDAARFTLKGASDAIGECKADFWK